jgi:hypothetical protein
MAFVVSAGGNHSATVLGMMHELFVHDPRCDWKFLAGNSAGALVCCGVSTVSSNSEYLLMIQRMFDSMCTKKVTREWSVFGSLINFVESLFYHKSVYRTTLPDMVALEFNNRVRVGRSLHFGVYNQTKGRYETMEGYSPEVVAASCSIPGVFEPVSINGDEYVDGGMGHIIPTPAVVEWCESAKRKKKPDRLDIMSCYPIVSFKEFRSTEYLCSNMKLAGEALETFICVLWNNLQRDLDELSRYFDVDVRQTRVFEVGNISVRIFAPEIGIYSSFVKNDPRALKRMYRHGEEVVKQMFKTDVKKYRLTF